MKYLIYGMIYLGSALMVYNIIGFVRFARFLRGRKGWDRENTILNIPTILVTLFFCGYVGVGLFGKPDLLIAGILFGGSIFVYIMCWLLTTITKRTIESEHQEAELLAAEESSRAKNTFLSGMSHEMRTPMNVILGLDKVALKNPELDRATREILVKIGQSGEYLLGLINNVLDLNSLEAGTRVVRHEVFSMRDITERLDAIAQTLCEQKGLAWSCSVSGGAEGWYIGDELLLQQAILPILDNAVKFTDVPGSVSLEVLCTAEDKETRSIRMRVTDTGIGMSPEFLEKAFERFSQEDASSTNRFGGSGLGLFGAKQRIELLGGCIDAESEKGKGSVFTITMDLKKAGKPQRAAEEKQDEGPAVTEETELLAGRRILIVDDLAENAEIAADLLELEGAESERAENGQVALDMFRGSPEYYYDAVLMDLRMPVMDGLETARHIREMRRADAKEVPIIALTANTMESDVRQSLEAGMNAHMVKPIDPDRLYEELMMRIAQYDIVRRGDDQ